MAFPIIIIACAATGIAGIAKGTKGLHSFSKAKKLNEQSNRFLNDTKYRLNNARKECNKSLIELGKLKVYILNRSMQRFISAFEKIKNYEFDDSGILNELKKFTLDKANFEELKNNATFATSIAESLFTGSVSGAVAAYGAYSSVAFIGAQASTGATISSLSGIAAHNATLAWLGGGAISAGGGGMAAGTVVLGSIALAPALLIGGLIINAKGSKALDEAKANSAKAAKATREMNVAHSICKGITNRSKIFVKLLEQLDQIFIPIIDKMEEIIENNGTDYSTYQIENKHTIAKAYALAGAIKSVLDTPILTEDGKLTSESGDRVKEIKQLLKENL